MSRRATPLDPRSSVLPRVPARVLFVAIGVVTASTLPVFLLGAAFVDMGSDFGYGPTGLGVLTGAFFLTSSASSAPLGRLVVRIGWRRAIRINAVASGCLVLAIGLVAYDTAVLAALLVAAAAVYGLANPAANAALAHHSDPRHRATIFGLKHAGIPSSTLLAGLAVPVLVVTAGWRVAYLVAAVVAAVVFVGVPSGSDGEAAPRQDDERRSIAPLGTLTLVVLSAGSAFATWGPVALSTYLVAAAVDVGFSAATAGLLLFAGSAASILARVIAGAITDRRGGRGFAGVATMLGVGAAVFVALPMTSGPAFAVLAVAAFASGWAWPGLMTYAVVNANADSVASSSAITQAGVFAGAGFGPFVHGWLVARYGFDAAWLLGAAGAAVSAVVVAAVGARARTGHDRVSR